MKQNKKERLEREKGGRKNKELKIKERKKLEQNEIKEI